VGAALVVLGVLVALSPTALAGAQNVPVSKVMLFSSGVGYFEHAGLVHGNSATELRFRTSQINDILKSLMLQDQGGGRVGAIVYPSQDPLAKTLRSFQVDITQNPSLADLLNQLRGARVTVQTQGERVSGTILGVESRRRTTDKGESAASPVLNLLAGATIRAVELQAVASLSLDDPQLQEELTKALAALVQARDQDKKPVTINFAGSGDRRVRIGYVVETPVWKTSYRLLLDDKGGGGWLQGWAIVENQTESDWNNVSLSLVSGRPISFTMDLYQPLYATRPNVVPELFASLRPQVYDGATPAEKDRVAMATPAPRRIGYGPDGKPAGVQLSEVVVTSASDGRAFDAASTVQAIAASQQLGELFEYTVPGVTLPRQKSAMLPIVTDSVRVERVSIYNERVLRTNPLNGVAMKNTTGKHLLQGPMTVLDHGGYAGDARIDNVPPGQERLLSFGVDLDLSVDSKVRNSGSVVAASITRGVMTVKRRMVQTQEYAVDNRGTRDKTIIIEHPVRGGWKLIDTQKPFETTPGVYRFKGSAPAGKVTTLAVKEEYVMNESITLAAADVSQYLSYSQYGEMPREVRDALLKAVRMRQAIADIDRQIGAKSQQITEITAEQNRIRENMKTVAPNGQYYDRLLAKLNEQESSIERLQGEREQLQRQRDAQQRELNDYLAGLTVG
jgi:hypothetical protein